MFSGETFPVCEAAHLPPSIRQHEETAGYSGTGHGVCGGHAVLRVVEDLHLHDRRGGGPGPADHILCGLTHEQVPGPDHDEPPADQGVDVPVEEREEDDEEHLVAQLGPKGEQVEQELVVDQELLTHISGQGVSPERFCPGGVCVRTVRPGSGGNVTLHPVNLRYARIPGGGPVTDTDAVSPLLRPPPQSGAVRLRQPGVWLGGFVWKGPLNATDPLKPRYMAGLLQIVAHLHERLHQVARHNFK